MNKKDKMLIKEIIKRERIENKERIKIEFIKLEIIDYKLEKGESTINMKRLKDWLKRFNYDLFSHQEIDYKNKKDGYINMKITVIRETRG